MSTPAQPKTAHHDQLLEAILRWAGVPPEVFEGPKPENAPAGASPTSGGDQKKPQTIGVDMADQKSETVYAMWGKMEENAPHVCSLKGVDVAYETMLIDKEARFLANKTAILLELHRIHKLVLSVVEQHRRMSGQWQDVGPVYEALGLRCVSVGKEHPMLLPGHEQSGYTFSTALMYDPTTPGKTTLARAMHAAQNHTFGGNIIDAEELLTKLKAIDARRVWDAIMHLIFPAPKQQK